MNSRTSFVISMIVALTSLGFNFWQYHKYSKRREMLRGAMSVWWEWAKSMRDHIDMYWDAAGHNPSGEKLAGLAKGTIDGLAKSAARLSNSIQKTVVAAGFPDPGERPWMKRDQIQPIPRVKQEAQEISQ